MRGFKILFSLTVPMILALAAVSGAAAAEEEHSLTEILYPVEQLRPIDSTLKVALGDPFPDFELPTISGGTVSLSDYKGKKNLVLSFVPAAWTPVCSGQWPGYNIVQDIFEANDTALVGVSEDNTPSQYAWVKEMGGLWFPVASDFWPHGELASALGILRSDGTSERALFLVDKQGIIRYIDVHDINSRPDLGALVKAMEELN